jgi:hypothetical protein
MVNRPDWIRELIKSKEPAPLLTQPRIFSVNLLRMLVHQRPALRRIIQENRKPVISATSKTQATDAELPVQVAHLHLTLAFPLSSTSSK